MRSPFKEVWHLYPEQGGLEYDEVIAFSNMFDCFLYEREKFGFRIAWSNLWRYVFEKDILTLDCFIDNDHIEVIGEK